MAKKTVSTPKPAAPAKAEAVAKPTPAPVAPAVPVAKTPAPAKKAAAPKAAKAVKAKPVKAAAPKAKRATKPAAPKAPAYTTEDVALRAYFISEKRRAQWLPGDEHQDWIEAERQLLEESKKTKKKV